jgi:predicted SnoaL-like aldol condensation-catalyzing enzyme
MAAITNKERAIAFIISFETGDRQILESWVSDDYIPHYPDIETGKSALLDFFDEIQKMDISIDIRRAIEDGDYVAVHSEYTGPLVVFDVFRFENGKIAEHWASAQESVQKTVNGHSMIDGPTLIHDLDKTSKNKALIKEWENVLINRDFGKIKNFFDDDNYVQHDPLFKDGLSGLCAGHMEMDKKGNDMELNKNHMIIGEGNFVLSINEGNWRGEHVSFFDLFRIENGKFAEHWDVIEPIKPPEEWKNKNGKF